MPRISHERTVWLAQHILTEERALRAWLTRQKGLRLDADDIVQETYAVLAELPSVAHILNPRAYMFTVARSVILQSVRRQRIVSIETVAEIEQLGILMDEITPERRVSDYQELRQMAELVAALPGKCRQAFMLRKVEGLSQRDVARRMQVSESTIEKHIARATRLLLQAIGHEATSDAAVGGHASRADREGRGER